MANGNFCATCFFGDGTCLTGVGFSEDACENLYAGSEAGAASSSSTCYNIGMGYQALKCINGGCDNVVLGCRAGCKTNSGYNNVFPWKKKLGL